MSYLVNYYVVSFLNHYYVASFVNYYVISFVNYHYVVSFINYYIVSFVNYYVVSFGDKNNTKQQHLPLFFSYLYHEN